MKTPNNNHGIVSAVLILPALFLCITGILYVGFGVESAILQLDRMMNNGFFKLLLSPLVVLGGPIHCR